MKPALAALALLFAVQQRGAVVDAFESTKGWTATPAPGSTLRVSSDSGYRGRSLRLDFDLGQGGGRASAAVRKAVNLPLPANYEFSYRVRGDGQANILQLRLIGATGKNVWASAQGPAELRRGWTEVVRQKRHFALGPGSKGEIARVAAIEILIAPGGRGTVWIDELQLRARESDEPYTLTPRVTASSEAPGFNAARALDGDPGSSWRSLASDTAAPSAVAPAVGVANAAIAVPTSGPSHTLVVDFLRARSLSGLVIDWEAGRHASSYTIDLSPDGKAWETRYRATGANGGRDYIHLPETETRFVRVAIADRSASAFGIREITTQPVGWAASRNAFFRALAKDAAAGSYPRFMSGLQSYWTIAGVDSDSAEVLVTADGMVEGPNGRFSVEPFVYVDGRLHTWRDVKTTQTLGGDHLPHPSVAWEGTDWRLTLEPVVAMGGRDSSAAYLEFRLWNRAPVRRPMRLYLAVRPFHVAAPEESPGQPGGVSFIRELAIDDGIVRVNGEPAVVTLASSSGFGATSFDRGDIVDFLRGGTLPPTPDVRDDFGHASAALAYAAEVDTGHALQADVAIPLHATAMPEVLRHRVVRQMVRPDPVRTVARGWRDALERVTIDLPASAAAIAHSLYANLGYILVNRDHARLQPGSRRVARSFVRDGAVQATALLRMGRSDVALQFLEWYAALQRTDGSVPCCADARGVDPALSHSSHGAFVHLVAEYWRHTQDRALADRMWPRVARAVAHIDSLRRLQMTAEFQTGDKRVFHGILPPSIDREGHTGSPVYWYAADFLALRGLKDAVELARALSRPEEMQLIAIRDEFRRDLYASIQLAMAHQRSERFPIGADRGDTDASSAATAASPGGEIGLMPETLARALDGTLERHWEEVGARRDGRSTWDSVGMSELRTVGATLRLGRRDRAHEMLAWYMGQQRPAGWYQWPTVARRDSTTPGFVGDMADGTVGAEYIGSVLDMLAYEREADSSLVVGAGVVESWVTERPGVTVRRLSTHYGPLSFTMRRETDRVRISLQSGLRIPPGGIVVHSPFTRHPTQGLVNGDAMPVSSSGAVIVRSLPAEVVFRR
jgi:hypothetical protein